MKNFLEIAIDRMTGVILSAVTFHVRMLVARVSKTLLRNWHSYHVTFSSLKINIVQFPIIQVELW